MKNALICLMVVLSLSVHGDDAPDGEIEVAASAGKQPVLTVDSDAREILRVCRAMLPRRPIEVRGQLILRNRKGIVASEHDYRLVMRRSPEITLMNISLFPRGTTNELASVEISRRQGVPPSISLRKPGAEKPEKIESLMSRVLDTDVTWLDLTMDFLWWPNAVFETSRAGESVHGQECLVILVKPEHVVKGLSAVRLWVDKKTGCMMQAEQVDEDGKSVRRLWGTRVRKMDGRWFVSVLEVETLGSRHRTKITVEGFHEI